MMVGRQFRQIQASYLLAVFPVFVVSQANQLLAVYCTGIDLLI